MTRPELYVLNAKLDTFWIQMQENVKIVQTTVLNAHSKIALLDVMLIAAILDMVEKPIENAMLVQTNVLNAVRKK